MWVNLKFINNELFSAHLPTFMTTASRFKPAEIVGGQIAPSPIPWQVSVQIGGSHFCGGTTLDTYTILSAAHCFDDAWRAATIAAAAITSRSAAACMHDAYLVQKTG